VRIGLACEAGAPPAEVLDLLEAAGLPAASLRDEVAPAMLPRAGGVWFLGSAADVLRACDRGALDAGVVGSDQLLEGRHGVADLLDLRCRRDELVFAVLACGGRPDRRLRVATRHPEAARRYFAAAGVQPELLELDEPTLAPGLGLAGGVVELRSRLGADAPESPAFEERGVVATCSARLVAGRSARVVRRDEVNALADALRAVVEQR
jgi:ATP phosphoribosyltransferase